MNYNTVYVGMDVHKESFTLCAYTKLETVSTECCVFFFSLDKKRNA